MYGSNNNNLDNNDSSNSSNIWYIRWGVVSCPNWIETNFKVQLFPRRGQSCKEQDSGRNAARITDGRKCRELFIGWQQIALLSLIITLLCSTSHVLAIRKGRLMTPSTFTALSGDLHVQIQFMKDDENNSNSYRNDLKLYNNQTTSTATATATSNNLIQNHTTSMSNQAMKFLDKDKNDDKNEEEHNINKMERNGIEMEIENITQSTLVISKYIDEFPSPLRAGKKINKKQQKGYEEGYQEEIEIIKDSKIVKNFNGRNIHNDNDNDDNELELNHQEKILSRQRKEIIHNIPVYPDPRYNVTQVKIPCEIFIEGGLYEMQVITNLKTLKYINMKEQKSDKMRMAREMSREMGREMATTTTLIPSLDERLKQILDVRWPNADMIVNPVRFLTYPERSVEVVLRFPDVNCDNAWLGHRNDQMPDFWLELIYCGKERSCSQLTLDNITMTSILYREQVRGYPKYRKFHLQCQLFGLAGNYAVQLRPIILTPNIPIIRRFLSVDWSDKYIFNVYARSIFPCDPHTGIGVLYEYPHCILEQGDRVRVYGKLVADVASLKPPTTLHYVAEQRVIKNQYSLYFDCDLFTEKFIEYCFVYVTQAITGAVADVRMDCLPTLPVQESDTGGWGPWSEWTPCSTSCLGGTRNRYRFCDSPPPRYGAKFCEGPSVETEKCGNSINDAWNCIYESSGIPNINRSNRTAVTQEIGPGCRCGCIVHLGSSKPKRIIAGATQSCPGRSFWLIQVDADEYISMQLDFLHLPCTMQYIKIRDGPSLSSTLVIEVQGGRDDDGNINTRNTNAPLYFESTGSQLLLEFFTDDAVVPMVTMPSNSNQSDASSAVITQLNNDLQYNNILCTGGFLASVQQLNKNMTENAGNLKDPNNMNKNNKIYEPYLKISKSKWHKFTLVHLSAIIFASIIIIISLFLGAQYKMRYRKYHLAIEQRKDEDSRLHTPRNSLTSIQGPPSRALSTTTLISEVIYMVKMRPKKKLRHSILRESIDAENLARESEMNEIITKQSLTKCDSEFGSNNSIITLRNEMISPIIERTISPASSTGNESLKSIKPKDDLSRRDTLKHKDNSKDNESIVSSGMSSICYSPTHLNKSSTIKMKSSQLDDRIKMTDSLRSLMHNRKNSVCSNQALTNGCYSSTASVISSATIRSTSYMKESKEKQNRRKVLARPTSDSSFSNQDDFELDYYDYNVTNNSTVPGSYLGMDPAYLIWIPPFDDDVCNVTERDDDDKTPQPQSELDTEPNENEPLYEEIKMPQYSHYLSPHSNSDSSNNTDSATPTPDELSPLGSNVESKSTTPNSEIDLKNTIIRRIITVTNPTTNHKSITPYLKRKRKSHEQSKSISTLSLDKNRQSSECIAMWEINGTKSEHNVINIIENEMEKELDMGIELDSMMGSYIEKETTVVKSPSDLQHRLHCQDIQFADESESDQDGKNIYDVKRTPKEILKEECKLLRNLKRVSTAIAANKAKTVKSTPV